MEPENRQSRYNGSALKWVTLSVLVAVVVSGAVGFAYLTRQQAQLSGLTAANQSLITSVTDLRSQLATMTARLGEQTAVARAETSARARPDAIRSGYSAGSSRQTRERRQPADSRLTQIQSRLDEQQKAISSSQEELNRARDDFQGKLDSTREELSGSINSTKEELAATIARTHDDLVTLRKRGDRNYYEFTLSRSKEFRRVGPLSLSVRKVNTKRKSYDLAMFVDDNQLQKKGVNLFEPLWIDLQDQSQPVQLVVNRITKDQIQGYIAAPKYKRSELAETTSSVQQDPPETVPFAKQQ
jgi:hypothetical protein